MSERNADIIFKDNGVPACNMVGFGIMVNTKASGLGLTDDQNVWFKDQRNLMMTNKMCSYMMINRSDATSKEVCISQGGMASIDKDGVKNPVSAVLLH